MSDTPDNTPSPAPAPASDALTPPPAPLAPEAALIAPEAAPKPKLTLTPKPGTSAPFAGRPGTSAPFAARPGTSAPFSGAQITAAQKLPSGKFSSPIPPSADDDNGPSPVLTVIAGLAAAAAIAFAYLLFLKTK